VELLQALWKDLRAHLPKENRQRGQLGQLARAERLQRREVEAPRRRGNATPTY
jgi:hypothetical protein